jgi:hypothetical protein
MHLRLHCASRYESPVLGPLSSLLALARGLDRTRTSPTVQRAFISVL